MPTQPIHGIVYLSQILVFLSRKSNFETDEYREFMGIGKSAAHRHLRTLSDCGMVELVQRGQGMYGGHVWRSLLKVEYREPRSRLQQEESPHNDSEEDEQEEGDEEIT